ncbi:MAG: PLP-dependent aminotransferase family protein [Amaricoccus sp.]|uniref:aminotransferase-like domain-containing protein n=1 Tax=Amaricoccus sp. TaxID=1872485 RepID=UPI0039E38EDB
MTNWIPEPAGGEGAFYRRLADGIEAAIASGAAPEGAKLPPQRDLAYDLGVTIGTVGRAYALLRERGLVSGEVGRGTYVLPRPAPSGAAMTEVAPDVAGTRTDEVAPGKQRLDSTAAPDLGQGAVIGEVLAGIARDHPLEVASYSRTFPASWAEAGRRWLGRSGWMPAADSVLSTLGAHSGALTAMAAVTAPGDRIVFEQLSYSQVARGARLIGRRIATVEMDAHGMIPDAFERVCAQQHPKLAFLMPTVHNPTLAIMPEDRRRAIARIAARYDVWLIEDDIYGALADDRTPMLASFAPERTFVLGGLSKAVAAGLRGGWIACPPRLLHRLRVVQKITMGGLPFLLAEAAARMVLGGHAADLRARTLAELADRQAIASAAFAGHDFLSVPTAPYLWLRLPETWLPGTFKAAAMAEDLLIDDEDEFKPAPVDRAFRRVRISFSSVDGASLATSLARLRQLLDSGDAGYDAVV